MKRKFQIGDKVRTKAYGEVGYVKCVQRRLCYPGLWYSVNQLAETDSWQTWLGYYLARELEHAKER